MQELSAPAIKSVVDAITGAGPKVPSDPQISQARYGFAAMEWAARGSCHCTACKLLRRAHVSMVDAVIQEVESDDEGADTQQA